MCSVISPAADTMSSAAENRAESPGQEEELKGKKRKISLSECAVCGSVEAKYRCPACLKHSCSLLCVKKHKEDSGCSGVRDKTAFVTLSHFDEMTLLSDYRFLEDTGRFTDAATRDKLIRVPHISLKAKKMAASARKMNITLRFLPITFSKSKENSTFFHTKEKQFMWHVKLIFPQSSAEFTQRRVSDRQTLQQILTPYIHPTESDPVTRQKLKMYALAPADHVKVFMKAEGRKANSVRYHELDMQKSLRDNLSYKTLIEYPVLHVVCREHWKDFPLKGPAEPASAQSNFATKTEGVDRKGEDTAQVLPSLQGSRSTGGTNIWTGTFGTSPETEPPKEKRAKTQSVEGEVEDGEIVDSSDEGEDEEEGGVEEKARLDKGCGNAKSPADGTQVIKDDPGDRVDVDADKDINKRSDSGRSRCINEDVVGSTDAATESADVSMTKEDAVK